MEARMHLIYLDESGNTGNHLNDPQQPIFVLGALIVPETCWQALERDLEQTLSSLFPDIASAGEEIHAGDLRANRGAFKGVPASKRVELRDAWMKLAQSHQLRFVYRSIEKSKYQIWLRETFGAGVTINPHIAAFPLVALVVNGFLRKSRNLGILISDDNKEVVKDLEKSTKQLRLADGPIKLSQIVEKCFFIDSTKSRILQLCDLCSLHARKKEEGKSSSENLKAFDANGITLLEPLIYRGNEQIWDVLEWLKQSRGSK